jgi:large subunit ribosomal protein L30
MVVGLIPSTRLTKAEREKIPKIRFDLAQEGITPEQWELSALDRGATIIYGHKKFNYAIWEE